MYTICRRCGKSMGTYFKMHSCDGTKPQLDEIDNGDLQEAMEWLIKNEPEFNKEEFWNFLSERKYIGTDNSYTLLPLKSPNKQLKLFIKHFITGRILWYVKHN